MAVQGLISWGGRAHGRLGEIGNYSVGNLPPAGHFRLHALERLARLSAKFGRANHVNSSPAKLRQLEQEGLQLL